MTMTKLGAHSPWGQIDHHEVIAEGIEVVETASHGGILLSAERHAKVYAKHGKTFAGGRWYEEDCDYAKVVVTFPECFTPAQVATAEMSVAYWAKRKAHLAKSKEAS